MTYSDLSDLPLWVEVARWVWITIASGVVLFVLGGLLRSAFLVLLRRCQNWLWWRA